MALLKNHLLFLSLRWRHIGLFIYLFIYSARRECVETPTLIAHLTIFLCNWIVNNANWFFTCSRKLLFPEQLKMSHTGATRIFLLAARTQNGIEVTHTHTERGVHYSKYKSLSAAVAQ